MVKKVRIMRKIFLLGWGYYNFLQFLLRTRVQLTRRAVPVFSVLSLSLNKESTKESQPRRSLLELPWHCRSAK